MVSGPVAASPHPLIGARLGHDLIKRAQLPDLTTVSHVWVWRRRGFNTVGEQG